MLAILSTSSRSAGGTSPAGPDRPAYQKILAHLGLPGAREDPQPPLPLAAAGAEQPTFPKEDPGGKTLGRGGP